MGLWSYIILPIESAGAAVDSADLAKNCAIVVGSATTEHLFSANGAVFISAWGNAPGILAKKNL